MARFFHQPDNPFANENGMVSEENYYQYKYLYEEDKRAIIGNKVIELNFISDTMEPTLHMCNNKYYTSKKKFRDETRARGCIEIGNDTSHLKPRVAKTVDKKQRREDIKRAINEIQNGVDTFKNTPYEGIFKTSAFRAKKRRRRLNAFKN